MRKTLLFGLALAAATSLVPAAQAGGGATITEIEILTSSQDSDNRIVISGVVKSSRQCEKFRAMQLVSRSDDILQVIDEGVTSKRGGFGFVIKNSSEFGDELTIRAPKQKAGPQKCGARSVPILF